MRVFMNEAEVKAAGLTTFGRAVHKKGHIAGSEPIGILRTELEAQLTEALAAVEWRGRTEEDGDDCCPCCDALAVQDGTPIHNDGCALGAALKAARGEPA